jgi:hypothetical protein
MVLRHVAGDGGVIAQLLSGLKSSVDRVDPVLLGEVAARMEELTQLARELGPRRSARPWTRRLGLSPTGVSSHCEGAGTGAHPRRCRE